MRFTQLPLDILYELKFYLDIGDIVSLSRTSAILRDVFLSISWNVCIVDYEYWREPSPLSTYRYPYFGRNLWLAQNARPVDHTVLSNPHRYSWFLQDSVYHIVPAAFGLKSFFDKRKEWLEKFFLSFPNLQSILFNASRTDLKKFYFEYPCLNTMVALKGNLLINIELGKRYDFSNTFPDNESKVNITNLYIHMFGDRSVPNSLNGTVGPLELKYLHIAFSNLSFVSEMLKCLSTIQKCGVMELVIEISHTNIYFAHIYLAEMLENIPIAVDYLDLRFWFSSSINIKWGRWQELIEEDADKVRTILKDNLVLHKVRNITYEDEISKIFVDAISSNCPFASIISHVQNMY